MVDPNRTSRTRIIPIRRYNQLKGILSAFFWKLLLSITRFNSSNFWQYPNLEYFIIDGGSTDGTVDIIRRYEKHLAGWVSEKDHGQTDAINKGIRMATGDYVAYQNSDDIFAPGALHRVAEAWRKNPNTGVFFGDMYIVDEEDRVLEEMRVPPFSVACHIYEGMQVFNQSLFVRRDLLTTFGLFDENLRFTMDYEIVARLGVQPGIRFQHVEGFWGGFRKQPDAKSSTIAEVGRAEHQQVKQKYQPFLKSSLGESFWFRYARLRKLLYFVARGQLSYVWHRLSLRT